MDKRINSTLSSLLTEVKKFRWTPERIIIASVAVFLIWAALELNVSPIPSQYQPTSVNYGRDKGSDLFLSDWWIGSHYFGPHPVLNEGLTMKIEFRGGPHNYDSHDVTEIAGAGFLAPVLKYRLFFAFAVFLMAAGLLSPFKYNLLEKMVVFVVIAYGLALVFIGLYGAFLTPARMIRDINNANIGAVVLLPLYLLLWLAYLLPVVSGIGILLRKRWAIIAGIIAHAGLILSLPFLIDTRVRPEFDMSGYLVEMDPFFYAVLYLSIVALMVLFFTRPRVRTLFR
jgi:hypothetical protein